ncbi:hypothetical protein TWF569_006189 [Orbilia oligospora]|nr:hypothetical protein TWF706_001818 [Orbilia oligospora]KAF3147099.1 hypothetical protein TWF569_006189 [Orbilia oligospora]KAF3149032.1 hypothetical protein TWF594_000480 [Orbilia oligospora]
MSRRSHKKSRNGCLQCKKRHIRCDGFAPICANCRGAELECSYLKNHTPPILLAVPNNRADVHAASPSSASNTSPAPSISSSDSLVSRQNDINSAPSIAVPFPEQGPSIQAGSTNPQDPFSINEIHLELFMNLSSQDFRSSEDPSQPEYIPSTVYIEHGLATPYLIHQMLAMSALHLSTTFTDRQKINHYHSYATGLQNRALSLFNQANPVLEVTSSNCIHMFLFSSAVGVHLLCDTLHYQRGSLDSFIEKFTHDVNVYRGVLAVVNQCSPAVREQQIAPNLRLGQVFLQIPDATGSECDDLIKLINASNIPESSREVYLQTANDLQRMFDCAQGKSRVSVLFTWVILLSPSYVALLRLGEPEALVVLAFYAVLLHRGRFMWLIGDGGRFLIEAISDRLGENWRGWLRFPIEALQEQEQDVS